MLRFLAITRRAMLIGILSLIISIFAMHVDISDIIGVAWPINGLYSAILFFFLISPVLYILFLVISTAYIRKHGQSAAIQSEKPFVITMLACLGSDLTSPYRAVKNLIVSLFSKRPDLYPEEYWEGSKRIYLIRFLEMLLFFALCFFGVQIILWNV